LLALGRSQVGVQEVLPQLGSRVLQIGHAECADRLNDIGFDRTKRHVHRHSIPKKSPPKEAGLTRKINLAIIGQGRVFGKGCPSHLCSVKGQNVEICWRTLAPKSFTLLH